jgi:HTH-type transcriptional regulator/antitoxin HigA
MEAEYDRLRTTVDELMNRDEEDLSSEEVKLLDLLVTLIDRYEETHYAFKPGTPHEMLHHLMEVRGLTHKDVWRVFGSEGVASEVLNGKQRLARHMHAPWPTSSTSLPISSLARDRPSRRAVP